MVQPLLLVLEDLHWADHGTLEPALRQALAHKGPFLVDVVISDPVPI